MTYYTILVQVEPGDCPFTKDFPTKKKALEWMNANSDIYPHSTLRKVSEVKLTRSVVGGIVTFSEE